MGSETSGQILTGIVSIGSLAWVPAALGHSWIDMVGVAPGAMGATIVAGAAVANFAEKFGLLD